MMRILGYFAVLSFVLTACKSNEVAPTEVSIASGKDGVVFMQDQIKSTGIKWEILKPSSGSATLSLTGTVVLPPAGKMQISLPFGGYVKELTVMEGMQVNRGTVLMVIENPRIIELQQAYLEAKSDLDYLHADYKRQVQLESQQASSQKALQQAKNEYERAKAKKDGVRLQLELAGVNLNSLDNGHVQREISVIAPFNGYVTKLNVERGQYVNPETALLELIDPTKVLVELNVFEQDVASIAPNQLIHVQVPGSTDTLDAHVYLIGKEITESRTQTVFGMLDSKELRLNPGTFVNAQMHLEQSMNLHVPQEAVFRMNKQDGVYVLQANGEESASFAFAPVDILFQSEGMTAFRFINASDASRPVVISGGYAVFSSQNMPSDD